MLDDNDDAAQLNFKALGRDSVRRCCRLPIFPLRAGFGEDMAKLKVLDLDRAPSCKVKAGRLEGATAQRKVLSISPVLFAAEFHPSAPTCAFPSPSSSSSSSRLSLSSAGCCPSHRSAGPSEPMRSSCASCATRRCRDLRRNSQLAPPGCAHAGSRVLVPLPISALFSP